MNMKLESSPTLGRSPEEIRDEFDGLEEQTAPTPPVRREATNLISFVKTCVGKFPMAAVWASFAGGLLIGAAVARRRHLSLQEMYLDEPLKQGRKLFSDVWSTATDAGRERMEHARSAVRMPDLDALRREATKLTRKMRF